METKVKASVQEQLFSCMRMSNGGVLMLPKTSGPETRNRRGRAGDG